MALARHAHVHHPAEPDVTTTLVLLHGTGGDEHQLVDLGRLLAPGAGLLGVRGNVLEGGGTTRWFRRLREGVFDTDDVVRRTDDLAAFLTAAVEAYDIDPTGLVVVGFSNGANTGAALLLRHPDLVRAGVLVSAVLPVDPDPAPDLTGHAVLMVQGRADPYAPVDRAEALAALLADAGASVEVAWHDDGHALGRAQADVAAGWLRRWMAATAASPGTSPA
jgi:phospholipase/carboxylesterase